jgi:putative oxidoreductase
MEFRFKTVIGNKWLVFAIRLLLGGCFLAASLSKLQNPDYFVATVVSYGILPDNLARIYGLVLPWLELTIGCSLIFGIFSAYASGLSVLLSLSFIVAGIHSLMYSQLEDCGCFGQWLQFSTPVSLAIDVILIIMAAEVLFHGSKTGFISIEALLHRYGSAVIKNNKALMVLSKLAIIILLVLVISVLIPGNTASSALEMDIDTVLDSGKYAILYFYAEGCPTCEAMKPLIARIEEDYRDDITVIPVNYDNSPQDVHKFAVVYTPTVLIITSKDGRNTYTVFQRFEGKFDTTELINSLTNISRH